MIHPCACSDLQTSRYDEQAGEGRGEVTVKEKLAKGRGEVWRAIDHWFSAFVQKQGEAKRWIAKTQEFHSSEPKAGLKGGNERGWMEKGEVRNGNLPVSAASYKDFVVSRGFSRQFG